MASLPALIGDYVFERSLGKGSFAFVKKAYHRITQTPVAIKVISKESCKDTTFLARFEREVEIFKNLDHPFVSQFYELLEDDSFYYVVMEYVSNGNLLDFVNQKGPLSENVAQSYFCQLISVLEYLHKYQNIAHRDLKAENVLLDRLGNLRVIDFGLSNSFSNSNPFLQTCCGSPAYAPPEMIRGSSYKAACDIWSAGVLLYAIVVGQLPYEDDNTPRLLQKIIYTEPTYPATLSPDLKHLLQCLLNKDPQKRYTIEQIRQHRWLSTYQYSRVMGGEFGISLGWRIFQPEGVLDGTVVQEMQSYSIDTTNLPADLMANKSTSLEAVYKMLKREKITDNMFTLSESSFSSLNHSAPVMGFAQLSPGALSVPKPKVIHGGKIRIPSVPVKAGAHSKKNLFSSMNHSSVLPNGSTTLGSFRNKSGHNLMVPLQTRKRSVSVKVGHI